ncbi:MAG: T9SS type A sorting domain-containing protein, partial [Bacteroidetes bacterium]|nr:T9SS type A sorting domain-containing protein [Bacteroidota bacterium]
ITAYNKITYVSTIDIVPNNGPYVMMSSFNVNDPSPANNNGLADYAEDISLNISLSNIGIELANNVTGILSCSDNNITITNNSYNFGNIDSNTVLSFSDIFGITIVNNVADQHVANFSLDLTDDLSNTWSSTFNMTINAPELSLEFLSLDDSNGNSNTRLDAGETVDIIVDNINLGLANSGVATCSISSINPYVTINNASVLLNEINSGANINAIFGITVDSLTPLGTPVTFNLDLVAGEYSTQLAINLQVGLIVEDWETNDFTSFSWEDLGYTPWIIEQVNTYEGSFAARSGAISDNGTSVLSIELNVLNDDSISFYKKVSCEPGQTWYGNYYYSDYLEFFIDNVSQGKWDGEIDWSREAYAVTSGIHSFSWAYKKDQGATSGEDATFIDYVILPAQFVNYDPFFSSTPDEVSVINENYLYEITTADLNQNQTFTIEVLQKPSWLSFFDHADGTATMNGITPSDTGTHVISLKVTDNEGASGIQNYNLVVYEDLSGINGLAQSVNFVSVYPNPVCEKALVEFELTQTSNVKLEVINLIGEKIVSFDENKYEAGSHSIEIDCENLASGVYFCRLLKNNSIFTKKFNVTK